MAVEANGKTRNRERLTLSGAASAMECSATSINSEAFPVFAFLHSIQSNNFIRYRFRKVRSGIAAKF